MKMKKFLMQKLNPLYIYTIIIIILIKKKKKKKKKIRWILKKKF